jgi:hypothetical protein
VLKAFSATGIHPPNANVILDRFRTATPETAATPPEQTALSSSPGEPLWLKAKSLLRSATKGDDAIAADALAQYIHRLSVQNQILQQQLNSAQEALTEKMKMKDKHRVLPLYAHNIE